jgi:hypothetical protein
MDWELAGAETEARYARATQSLDKITFFKIGKICVSQRLPLNTP